MRVCAMAACAVVAAGMVLTGCGPAAPATSGTPTVVGTGPTAAATPLCTPESGGSATPCTQQQYEEMKKLDALYAEAEDVYRRFVAEDVKLLHSGGLAEAKAQIEHGLLVGRPAGIAVNAELLKNVLQCKAKGMTQKETSLELGVSKVTVHRYWKHDRSE